MASKIKNAIKEDDDLITDEYKFNISDWLEWTQQITKEQNTKFLEIEHNKFGSFLLTNKYNLKAFPFDSQTLKLQFYDPSKNIFMQLIW